MNNQADSSDAQFLREDLQFQQMPAKIRSWILESPNAATEFATFFRKGGTIETLDDIKLPYYKPDDPPKILVKGADWHFAKQPGSEYIQFYMFGTLAHEIGHDRFNTGTVPFTGTTAEEYVQYRSELESNAIFNAFPIFKDLERHSDFKQSFPFDAIGYLNGLDLGKMYGQWRRGELDDQTAVDRMARKVADAPYTLGNPPHDMNRDGALTHRDKYLQDFEQYVKHRLALQPSIRHSIALDDPNRSDHLTTHSMPSMAKGQTGVQEYRFYPRTPEDDYLDAYLDAIDRNDYASRRVLTQQYEQLPHVQALQQEAREVMLAEQQLMLKEQLRQEQERQRLMLQMQQEQEHSRSLGFSR